MSASPQLKVAIGLGPWSGGRFQYRSPAGPMWEEEETVPTPTTGFPSLTLILGSSDHDAGLGF